MNYKLFKGTMITRRYNLKILPLSVFLIYLNGSLAYIHDASFNSQTFTVEDVLPPLASLSNSEQNGADRGVKYNRHSRIPVVYTNDPESVSLWLSENAPDGQTGIIGFDTEVRKTLIRRYACDVAASLEGHEDC